MTVPYDPGACFHRLDALYLAGGTGIDRAWQRYAAQPPWRRRRRHLRLWIETAALMARLATRLPDRSLRNLYFRRFWRFFQSRRNPAALRVYAMKCAVHHHMYQLVGALQARDRPLVNTY